MKLTVFDILPTPNPNAMRFVLNTIIAHRPRTVTNIGEAAGDALSEEILHFSGVTSVFYLDNFITVTKSGGDAWPLLGAQIKSLIEKTDYFPVECPVTFEPAFSNPDEKSYSDLHDHEKKKLIEKILDDDIRPGLQADGGGIELRNVADKKIQLHYMGACGNCPSSETATLNFIKLVLNKKLGTEIQVELV